MGIIDDVRAHADAIRAMGRDAIEACKAAGFPVHYESPHEPGTIVCDAPDGSHGPLSTSRQERGTAPRVDGGRGNRPPRLTVLAGPNGSGKSTLQTRLGAPGAFVNADVVARRLSPDRPEAAALRAGREVIATLDRLLADREDVVYETTLSGAQPLALMRRARSLGYEVALVFVSLCHADLNVLRVAQRVAMGGHHIPEEVVRRRHAGALERLRMAVPLADASVAFDNSSDVPVLVAAFERGRFLEGEPVDGRSMHEGMVGAIAEALGVDVRSAFGAGAPNC